MDRFYNIAGFLIRITGEESEAILYVQGFEAFEVGSGKPYLTLRLMCKADQVMPEKEESAHPYTFESKGITSSFSRLTDYSYCLTMMSDKSSEPLLLHYRPGSRECLLVGSMQPNLLYFALWTTFGILTAGQAIAIHASSIVFEDKAVIFLGESGTKKNAYTRLWQENIPGTTLLNDDSPIIRIDGSIPYIYGSPWSGTTPCFRNERFPLAGIVCLSQASHNEIRRLWMLEAIGAMFSSCPPMFGKDRELSRQIYDTLSEVLTIVPVWHLKCLPDKAAVKLSHETVFHSEG